MKTLFNKFIVWCISRDREPREYETCDKRLVAAFDEKPNGFYLIHCYASNTLFGKLIAFFTKADYSHTVLAIKCSNLIEYCTPLDTVRVFSSLNSYYGKNIDIYKDPLVCIIISNMTKYGAICCSLSRYSLKRLKIQKLPSDQAQDMTIAKFLCARIGVSYDTTGVVGYNIGKSLDDPKSYYCSELCYDACAAAGIRIAAAKNPSPADVVSFCEDKFETIFDGRA